MGFSGNNGVERAFRAVEFFGRTVGSRQAERPSLDELPRRAWWTIGRVRTGWEFAVADDLTASGAAFGFAPFRLVRHACARLGGSNSQRRAVTRAYPLILGYVFMGCAADVYVRRGAHPGLIGLVGDACGRPGVSQAVMDDLNRLQNALAAAAPDGRRRVNPGDVVAVEVGGVLLRGVVTALTRAGVMVETGFLGRLSRFQIGLEKIN